MRVRKVFLNMKKKKELGTRFLAEIIMPKQRTIPISSDTCAKFTIRANSRGLLLKYMTNGGFFTGTRKEFKVLMFRYESLIERF